MPTDLRYTDDELIAILIKHHREVNNCAPDKAELAKIKNTINFDCRENKHEHLQPLRSYFYKQHAHWPSTNEYEKLLKYFYGKYL